MKMWIGKLCAIMVVALVFLEVGVKIGSKNGKTVEIQPVTSYRFQPLADGKALDTKMGTVCTTISLPAGATLDDGTPSCHTLDSQ